MYKKELQKLLKYCVRNEISLAANAIRIFIFKLSNASLMMTSGGRNM
jgi:hypothetical protein